MISVNNRPSNKRSSSFAFAPASIGNVSIGFDILGMAISGVGDQIKLTPRKDKQVKFVALTGTKVPDHPAKNTAGAALLAMIKGEKLAHGFDVELRKGIPLGSGMGGSAASAVAAVVAAQVYAKASKERLLKYALEGEKVASGSAHPDNVAPSLYGGLTLASMNFSKCPVVELPFPRSISWALVHPDVEVKTEFARGILKKDLSLSEYVDQSARLASFISGLHMKNMAFVRQGFADLLIEPQRAHLIPSFDKIKKMVLANKNTLGFSISGSGPSVFFWMIENKPKAIAHSMAKKVQAEFAKKNISSQIYFGFGPSSGARIIQNWLPENKSLVAPLRTYR